MSQEQKEGECTTKHVFTMRELQAVDDQGNKVVIEVEPSGKVVSAKVLDREGKEVSYKENERFELLLRIGDPQREKRTFSTMVSGCWLVVGGVPKFYIPCPY